MLWISLIRSSISSSCVCKVSSIVSSRSSSSPFVVSVCMDLVSLVFVVLRGSVGGNEVVVLFGRDGLVVS